MPERVKVVAMIYEYKTFFYSPNLNQFPMVFNCSIKKKPQIGLTSTQKHQLP